MSKDFDQRWQTLAAQARQVPEEQSLEDLPLAFTTRVMARAREVSTEAWEEVFNLLGLRAVLATAVVFLLSVGFIASEWYDSRLELPALEKTLTSDLSWP